jgi:tetratricopeptide (TPR) repeat protein
MTTNKYYFQALDNFPYNLEETMQALNYALSYDDHNAESLCLLGRVYSEMLQDYETAKTYFEEAMQVKLDSVSTPLFYIDCLLNNEDYKEAKKLIEYAKGIKGIDQSRILYRKAIFFEKQEKFKKALKILEKAKKNSANKNYLDFITERINFIKAKIEKPKKGKDQKKSSNK